MEKKPLISFKLSKEGSEPIAFNLNKVQEYFVKLYWESPHDLDVSALILLCSGFVHLPEIVTGLIGVLIIGVAFYQSIQANKKEALNTSS